MFQELENISLVAIADGIPQPSILWLRDGIALQTSLNVRFEVMEEVVPGIRVDIPFALKSTLTIWGLTNADTGEYSCRASNKIGMAVVLLEPYQVVVIPG